MTGELIKGGADRAVDWVWSLCNIILRVALCLMTGDLL